MTGHVVVAHISNRFIDRYFTNSGTRVGKYLKVNDVACSLDTMVGVVNLDTYAPIENRPLTVVGAIEINHMVGNVIAIGVNTIRYLGHVILNVIVIVPIIKGEDLVIIKEDTVTQLSRINGIAFNIGGGQGKIEFTGSPVITAVIPLVGSGVGRNDGALG